MFWVVLGFHLFVYLFIYPILSFIFYLWFSFSWLYQGNTLRRRLQACYFQDPFKVLVGHWSCKRDSHVHTMCNTIIYT